MSKKTLLISGSRFALALCAGFATTGIEAASAQMVGGNTGCLITATSSVLGAMGTATAGVSDLASGAGNSATSYVCAGVAYATASPLQTTVNPQQPETSGHSNMVGGVAMYDSATGTVAGAPQSIVGASQSSLPPMIIAVDPVLRTADGGLGAGYRGEMPRISAERMAAPRHEEEGRDYRDFGSANRHTNHHRSERVAVVDVRTDYARPSHQIARPINWIGGGAHIDVTTAVPGHGNLPIQYTPDATGNPTATVNLVTVSPPAGTTSVTTTGAAPSGTPTTSNAAAAAAAAAANAANAANAAQASAASQAIAYLGPMTVKYDAAAQGAQPSVTLASPNGAGPVAIHNVAPGVTASDAATVGQLNQMGAAIDSRLTQDEKEIYKAKSLARGAGAIAMATASLRYDDRVGRGSVGFGLGNFAGATALATGLNYNVTEALRVNANAAYVPNTRNVGFGLGATYTFW